MYGKSAHYYDALHHFKDYQAEAAGILACLRHYHPQARTVLDVACGTGRHLELLRPHYEVEGLDLNPDLLASARERCPGVAFHQGDMTGFDLGKRYDVVMCLFGSIACVRTPEQFSRAIASMGRHVAAGGLLVIERYFTPEQFWVGRVNFNTVNEPDLKIAWMFVTEKLDDRLSRLDMHFLVGTPAGVEHIREVHEHGLFTHEEYLQAFGRLGFRSHLLGFKRGLYVAGEQLRDDALPTAAA